MRGQPRCPQKLQAIFDWLAEDCPDEGIYSSLCRRMEMAVFKRILACLKTQSAAGPSGLSYAVLLSSTEEFLTVCLLFINLFLRSGGSGPLQWLRSDITAIPKSSEVRQGIDSSRPIGLMEVLRKVAMSFLDTQATQIWREKRVLWPYQFGFQRHHSVAEAARMVFDALQFTRAKGADLWAALSDARAAFPSVPAWEWRKAYRRVRLPGWVQGCMLQLQRVTLQGTGQHSPRAHAVLRRA